MPRRYEKNTEPNLSCSSREIFVFVFHFETGKARQKRQFRESAQNTPRRPIEFGEKSLIRGRSSE